MVVKNILSFQKNLENISMSLDFAQWRFSGDNRARSQDQACLAAKYIV